MLTITLTLEQARIAQEACELLARLEIGQFERIVDWLLFSDDAKDYLTRQEKANSALLAARDIIFEYSVRELHTRKHQVAWELSRSLNSKIIEYCSKGDK